MMGLMKLVILGVVLLFGWNYLEPDSYDKYTEKTFDWGRGKLAEKLEEDSTKATPFNETDEELIYGYVVEKASCVNDTQCVNYYNVDEITCNDNGLCVVKI